MYNRKNYNSLKKIDLFVYNLLIYNKLYIIVKMSRYLIKRQDLIDLVGEVIFTELVDHMINLVITFKKMKVVIYQV